MEDRLSPPSATPTPAIVFDYELVNTLLHADPNNPNLVQCVPFQINDDLLLEDLFEGLTMTLSLVTPDPRITIVDGIRESAIQDNDRECIFYRIIYLVV